MIYLLSMQYMVPAGLFIAGLLLAAHPCVTYVHGFLTPTGRSMPINDAIAECRSMGGTLPMVYDEETNTALSRVVGRGSAHATAWIHGWTRPLDLMENYDDLTTVPGGFSLFPETPLPSLAQDTPPPSFWRAFERWKDLYPYDWMEAEYDLPPHPSKREVYDYLRNSTNLPLATMFMLEAAREANMSAIYLDTADQRWYPSLNSTERHVVCDLPLSTGFSSTSIPSTAMKTLPPIPTLMILCISCMLATSLA